MTKLSALKAAGLAIVAATTGIIVLAATPASAQIPPTYTYSSPAALIYAPLSGWYCVHDFTISNPSSTPVTATIKEYRGGSLTQQATQPILAGGVWSGGFYVSQWYGFARFEVTAPSGRLVPASRMQCYQGSGKTDQTYDASQWSVVNPNGSTTENLQRANGMLDAIAAKIDAIAAKIDAANGKLDAANGKLDALAAKVGNKTTSVCVDGSVRNAPTNRNQMYLTLFNPANGAIANASVTYNTNLGPVFRTYGVGPLQRVQIDVSNELVGPTGAYPLRIDVDTVVSVTAPIPLHVNCSVYFSKTLPNVGLVSGALELPVSTN